MFRTLKIGSYRGRKIYYRHLLNEKKHGTFEYLISDGENVYCHPFVIAKRKGDFTEEEYKNILDMMSEVAINYVDMHIYQRSFLRKLRLLKTHIKNAKQIIKEWIEGRTPSSVPEEQGSDASVAREEVGVSVK